MNQAKSEAFPRRDADAINRRRSITAGAAALLASTMISRRNAHPRNGRHNCGNNGGNNVGSRCKRQQEQCLAFVEERCTAAVAAGVTAELRAPGDCVSQNRSCCAGQVPCWGRSRLPVPASRQVTTHRVTLGVGSGLVLLVQLSGWGTANVGNVGNFWGIGALPTKARGAMSQAVP